MNIYEIKHRDYGTVQVRAETELDAVRQEAEKRKMNAQGYAQGAAIRFVGKERNVSEKKISKKADK